MADAGGSNTQPHTDMRPGTVVTHWPLQRPGVHTAGHLFAASALLKSGPASMSRALGAVGGRATRRWEMTADTSLDASAPRSR
jgi:hypothetical protein